MSPATPLPDFRSPDFLRAHVGDTLGFYLPRAIDPAGGLFHFLRDDGSVMPVDEYPASRVVHTGAPASARFGGIVGQPLGLLGFDLGFGFDVERLVVVIGFLDLRREGGSLRHQRFHPTQ